MDNEVWKTEMCSPSSAEDFMNSLESEGYTVTDVFPTERDHTRIGINKVTEVMIVARKRKEVD